ncbi:hypothetical protein IEZ26_06080 [Nocardioides cavernae]|uniref:Uncharacterized protein n=1 Tax=Nocardioides cavernae TaxID=1921566 RepID=A0ABR8N7R0_9ACTN|nr:hypothetical protein [Nocardioides cavernae]MBD3924182.1 hypothetical protein [Nocardioides cavernae]MBM7510880.1 hypothetical protein [Nocardioides cavernae]
MPIVQYTQHDWPPGSYALVFFAAAALFLVGMGIFLIGANREQRGTTARHARGDKHGPVLH